MPTRPCFQDTESICRHVCHAGLPHCSTQTAFRVCCQVREAAETASNPHDLAAPLSPSTKRAGFHCATFAHEHFPDHLWCMCQEFETWDHLAASSAIQSIQGALPESAPVTSPQRVLGPLAPSYSSRELAKPSRPRQGPSPAGCCLLELLSRSV